MVNSVSVTKLQLPRQLPVQIPNTASAARSGMCMNLDRSGTYRGIYTCYTCKSVLLFSNYHSCCKHTFAWSVIDPWPGGPKSYLWQPVIASPVIQQTKMEEPQTAVSALLGLVSVAY